MTENKIKKPRKKRALRKIFFSCSAAKDGNVVVEEYEVPSIHDADVAASLFEEQNNIKPQQVRGPFYRVKGTGSAENRVAVTLPGDKIRMSGKIWEGVFQGWNVVAHGVKACEHNNTQYDEDEVVYILSWEGPAVKGAPRPRFGGNLSTVYRSAIEQPVLRS